MVKPKSHTGGPRGAAPPCAGACASTPPWELEFATLMPNFIPPRQCPLVLHMNQYVVASSRATRSAPLAYLLSTPELELHDLYVSSVT